MPLETLWIFLDTLQILFRYSLDSPTKHSLEISNIHLISSSIQFIQVTQPFQYLLFQYFLYFTPQVYFVQYHIQFIEVKHQIQFTHVIKVYVKDLYQEMERLQVSQLAIWQVNCRYKVESGISSVDEFYLLVLHEVRLVLGVSTTYQPMYIQYEPAFILCGVIVVEPFDESSFALSIQHQ